MAVINIEHMSLYLKYGLNASLILPDKYDKGDKLKCLWLYHGSSGDHMAWMLHANLTEIANKRKIAIILPNVRESCFVDMAVGEKYGSYVGRELYSMIHNMFAITSDKREANAVSGFSNGGYGCMHIGLKYPKKYAYIGALSAGDKAESEYKQDGSLKSKYRERLFGVGDISNTEYSFLYQAKLLKESGFKNPPKIYQACGELDPWVGMSRNSRDFFEANADFYDYKYVEDKGYAHEWDFWTKQLDEFLDYIGWK